MTRILAAFVLTSLAATAARAQEAPLRFVFFADTRPVLIDLRAEIDGKPAAAAWSDYLRKWFDLLDRDRDGLLDAKETQYAPTDDLMLQVIRQGIFYPRPGMAPKMQSSGDKIRFADFLRYYGAKAGPYQFGIALQANNAGSTILHQAIDRDRDKALTRSELEQAARIMDTLDKSDDEIITADELGGTTAGGLYGNQAVIVNGGGQPAQTIGNDAFLHVTQGVGGKLALLLLTHYDRNADKCLQLGESGMNAKTFAGADSNSDGQLDVVELAAWHERPADLQLVSRLGRVAADSKVPRVEAVNTEKLADVRATEHGVLASIGDAQITLKTEPENPNPMMGFNRSQYFTQIFRQADKSGKGVIEMNDIPNARYSLLTAIFPLADVNDDGKMTEEELRGFVVLQDGAKDCFATISIADQGRGFFQILDANRDGRLSVRELRTAWPRMLAFDVNQDSVISGNEVARQFQLSISRGQNLAFYRTVLVNPNMAPASVVPAASRAAPLWFRKMDQNNDGDISRREFLGSRAQFMALDLDGDGLISPIEGTAASGRPER